ncbi:tetratricopeptide repeat protein, partial [Helicobacter pylori]
MLKKSLLWLVFLILQLSGAEENNQAPKNTPPELNPANAKGTPSPNTQITPKNDNSNLLDKLGSPENAQTELSAGIELAKKGDYQGAFKLFSQSCDNGNAAGCFAVGAMYANGVGIQTNRLKAARYYEMGCSGGDATACANLAQMYENKKNADSNDKENALQLYAVACQGGDMLACNNLGWMFANGSGVPKDYYKAISYYKFSCENGNDMGCYNLGLMSNVNNIYGIDKAKLSQVDLNYLACNAGDMMGCANLGWIYANGDLGAPLNNHYAAKYFQMACDGGILGSC